MKVLQKHSQHNGVNSMIAYKLMRKRKNGTLGSLFINKKVVIPLNVKLEAENHPTKGYQERFGWHCTFKPVAPHLSTKGRVWVKCEVEDYEVYNRPESQGGQWVLAKYMKVLQELDTVNTQCTV
jgi:hypothetical protein